MGSLFLYKFNTKLALSFYAVFWRIGLHNFSTTRYKRQRRVELLLRPSRLSKAAKKKNITKPLDNSIRNDTDKGIGKKIAKMDKNVFMP
jgi:hypothetical protein